MKQTLVWILVAANVSLAGTLAWRGFGVSSANAQAAAQPQRPAAEPGRYVLIPGEPAGGGASIIYVFDAANRRLGALVPDSKEVLQPVTPISVADFFENAEAGIRTPTDNQPRGNGRQRNNNR